MPKVKRDRQTSRWPHRSTKKAAAETFETSDLIALSAPTLGGRLPGTRCSLTALRTHRALEETHAMLEQATHAIQRAHALFLPLGLTRSPV